MFQLVHFTALRRQREELHGQRGHFRDPEPHREPDHRHELGDPSPVRTLLDGRG